VEDDSQSEWDGECSSSSSSEKWCVAVTAQRHLAHRAERRDLFHRSVWRLVTSVEGLVADDSPPVAPSEVNAL